MLKEVQLSKTYGVKQALCGVSFELDAGELVGLIGQNGAGKSTLLRILAGRLAPSRGQALVRGHDVLWEPEAARQHVGYLPEKPALYDEMTVRAQLEFACALRQVDSADAGPHIAELAERTGIGDVLGRRVGNLSKGYRQRVGLAVALTGNPEIVLLDEPTNGLDPVQIQEFRALVASLAKERLVILSTHILRDLDGFCTRALMLHEGRLIRDLHVREEEQAVRVLRANMALGRDAAAALLKALPSVERFEFVQSASPGITAALLTCGREAPVERALFHALAQADAPLLALYPVRSELEELFLQTVSGDRAKGNAKD